MTNSEIVVNMQEMCHIHNDICGHVKVTHGDHDDYIVNGKLHHYNKDNNTCEEHGLLQSGIELQNNYILRKYHLNWTKDVTNESHKKFFTMLFMTGGFFLVELIVGIMIGSIALQADAFHMLSDVLALVIGYWSAKMTNRDKSNKATYGYNRMEIIGSLINSIFLLSSCLFITLSAAHRFFELDESNELESEVDKLMIVAGIGLFINLIGLFIFRSESGGGGHGHSHGGGHGHSHGNLNERGVYLHILGDTLGSIGVMLSGIIIMFVESKYKLLADPLCSLAIVIIIVYNSLPLAKTSIRILLHKTPVAVSYEDLVDNVLKIEGITNVHDLHIWSLDQNVMICSMHVVMDTSNNIGDTIDKVKILLHKYNIHSTTVQPEIPHGITTIESNCQDPICSDKNCLDNSCC
jgi:zinc transporter 1